MPNPPFIGAETIVLLALQSITGTTQTPIFQLTNDTEEVDIIVNVTVATGTPVFTVALQTDMGIVGGSQTYFTCTPNSGVIGPTGQTEFRVSLGGVPGGGRVAALVTWTSGTNATLSITLVETRGGQPAT